MEAGRSGDDRTSVPAATRGAGGHPYIVDEETGGIILDQQEEITDCRGGEHKRKATPEEIRHSQEWREHLKTYRQEGVQGRNTGPDDDEALRELRRKTIGEAEVILEQEEGLKNGLRMLGFEIGRATELVHRWRIGGRPRLRQEAPYTVHVIATESFLREAMKQWPHRGTSRADFVYFFYLPFCHVFASNDKTQTRYAKVCANRRQKVISGAELRRDLAEVEELEAESGKPSLGLPPARSKGIFANILDRRWQDGDQEQRRANAEPHDEGSHRGRTPGEWMRLIDEAQARGTRNFCAAFIEGRVTPLLRGKARNGVTGGAEAAATTSPTKVGEK